MHAFYTLYILGSKVKLDSLQPLPEKRPYNPRTNRKPPSLIYTSPESLEFIKSRDKDANEDFDSISLLSSKLKNKKKNPNLKRKLNYNEATEASSSKSKSRPPQRKATKKAASFVELADDSSSEASDAEYLASVTPSKKQLGSKSGKLPLLKQEPYYKCGKCHLKASQASEFFWVYCPVCLLLHHMHCIEQGCGHCGFEPKVMQLQKKKK